MSVDVKKLKELSKNMSILYVEDENLLRKEITVYLKKFFSNVLDVACAEDAIKALSDNDFDIIITDIRMPGMNGVELSKVIKDKNPNQEILVVSAHTESNYFLDLIKLGVSGYIIKPIDYRQLNNGLFKIVEKITKYRENEAYKFKLESLAEKRTKEIMSLHKEKTSNYKKSLFSMAKMIEERDTYTAGHSQRVAKYCVKIAKVMNLDADDKKKLYEAGLLHDIGKISTPDSILLKPGKLNDIEYKLIQTHVMIGYNFLSKIPMYRDLANIIKYHHERYDGKGYPFGLSKDEIPILSHIMIVADAFDAITTSRIYKKSKTVKKAIDEILELAGSQFHPEVAQAAAFALNNITIQKDIDQLPKTKLEEERFAYFYKDTLTGLYNKNYLEFCMQNKGYGNKNGNYRYALGVFLRNFTSYNEKYGWENGDILLIKIADCLRKKFPDSIAFRIYGDDFIVLSDNPFEIKKLDCIDIEGLDIGIDLSSIKISKESMFSTKRMLNRLLQTR